MSWVSRLLPVMVLTGVVILGAVPLRADTLPNPLHPAFQLLDAQGKPLPHGEGEPDQNKTCGQCHDTAYIAAHSLPAHQQGGATCLACHYQGGQAAFGAGALEANGLVKRDWLRIAKPAVANCGSCHGLTAGKEGTVSIPEDYRAAAYPSGLASEHYLLSRAEGAIFSPQEVAASYLNLANKQNLHFPWDVHARKMMQCTDCHYAPNDPKKPASQPETVALLRDEPRRETISEYLQKPDHHLAAANCQTCHEPQRGHAFLPYPARHFEVLACQSCHIPRQLGPAERMVDATLLDESGHPRVEYRGIGTDAANLNTAYTQGSVPALLPVATSGKTGQTVRFAPVNVTSRWYWTGGDSKTPLPREILLKALMVNGHYRPELVAALDTDRDGKLAPGELRLDSDAKRQTVAQLLRGAGVNNPTIRAAMTLNPVSHGVAGKSQAISDCAACHGPDSRLKTDVLLTTYTPGGIPPALPEKSLVAGRIDVAAGGQVVLKPQTPDLQGFHVFGAPAKNWPDQLGLLMLLGVVSAVSLHAGYRLVTRGRRRHHHAPVTRREYLFSTYERLWHWVMALCVLTLIVTGLEIHFPGWLHFLGGANAVATHNFFAVVLMVNAFLALFYHLTTAAIRQFIPRRQGLAEAITRQTKYYLSDIFKGLPAPFPRSADRKLNALQQITYLFLLNFLFPFQMITGVLIWLVGTYPSIARAVGGLALVAPLHNLGSWMFISFLVAHVYLATTGHTVTAHVRGMVEGYEDVELPGTTGGQQA